jgi:hypothetical protein
MDRRTRRAKTADDLPERKAADGYVPPLLSRRPGFLAPLRPCSPSGSGFTISQIGGIMGHAQAHPPPRSQCPPRELPLPKQESLFAWLLKPFFDSIGQQRRSAPTGNFSAAGWFR